MPNEYTEIPTWFLDLVDVPKLVNPIEHPFMESVRDALELLDPEDMQILLMRTNELLSFQDIGDEMGYSKQYAHRRYHQALGRLREELIADDITY